MNNNKPFSTLVQNHFEYLVSEFGYSITKSIDNPEPFNDGTVEFQSRKTIIRVIKDQNHITLYIKPRKEPEISLLSLPIIVNALSIKENLPGVTPPSDDDNTLKENARVMKSYCQEFIKGDFSRWVDLLMFRLEKMKGRYLSMTGNELPYGAYNKLEKYINSSAKKNFSKD